MGTPWASVEEQRAALYRAAARSGCTITSAEPRRTTMGDYLAASIDCPDGWAGARLLASLSEEDAQTAGARDDALAIRRRAPSDLEFVRAVFKRAKRLRFTREPGETFAMGSYTLDAGAGDCDDHARVVYALLRAGGVPARIVFLHAPDGDPAHAVTQAHVGGAWRYLETTVDADMGENPMVAARRLGLVRDDIAPCASYLDDLLERRPMLAAITLAGALAALTPEQVAQYEKRAYTSELSPAFFQAVAAVARRMQLQGAEVTGEDVLAVLNGETGVRPNATLMNTDGLLDYGMSGMHGPSTLRSVGWKGTPEEYLALDALGQLPYVERYFQKAIPSNAWPWVKGARSLYASNAWPGYFATRPSAFQIDDYVIARSGKGAYYSGFALTDPGVNYAADIDKWISKRQIQEGNRWIEMRERYWIESGEIPPGLTLRAKLATGAFLAGCSALAAYLALDA